MTQLNQSELRKDESLILFMAELGWVYGKYDDQCFHVFDESGENTMTRGTATVLKAYITANYTANSEVEQLKSRIAWLEGKIEGLSNDNLTPHLTPHLTPKKLPRFEP